MSDLRSNLRIGERLGNGHFGEVHLGDDPVNGSVAVKIYRAKDDEPPEAWVARKASLLAEGVNLRRARHRNVVEVHHTVESAADDEVHLVMALCERGSLQPAYEAGPMQTAEVHRIATDICHGLGALHDRGMIHRDIKPGNILLDRAGTAKLGDFGLVTDDIILGYAEACGYIDHLAPEVFETHQTSSRSDFWALGMTLYRLLNGAEWYRSSPAPRTLVQEGGFAERLKWLPHISPRWRRLIKAMMHDDPHSRLANNGRVLDALADIAGEDQWTCTYSADSTRWERYTETRRIEVLLFRDGRRWEWTATSYPLAVGVKRSLGSSGGPQIHADADRSLRRYFES